MLPTQPKPTVKFIEVNSSSDEEENGNDLKVLPTPPKPPIAVVHVSSSSDEETEEKTTAEVFSCCNKTILKGPFTNLRCLSVRIGSFKVVPTSPVLLSSEGIVLKVPIGDSVDQSSSDSSITITIMPKQLLQFEAHFSRHFSVIFLHVTQTVSRQYSEKLGLKRNIHGGPFWDSLSSVESQKWLTLFPECLEEAAKESMKQTFTRSGVFREITLAKANEILVKSSIVETERVQKSILTTTDFTLLPISSNKNSSNKENGSLKEVTLIFLYLFYYMLLTMLFIF